MSEVRLVNGNLKWIVALVVAAGGGFAMGGPVNKELVEYRLAKLEEGQERIFKILEERLPPK
jgi:fructose-specific phosphotransferase system IIC component